MLDLSLQNKEDVPIKFAPGDWFTKAKSASKDYAASKRRENIPLYPKA